MQTVSIPINRWGCIQTSNSCFGDSSPVVYINPHRGQDLHKPILLKIDKTNSPYDNSFCWAKPQLAQNTAGYRPNYQDKTGEIVLVLDKEWLGYPPRLGEVCFIVEQK